MKRNILQNIIIFVAILAVLTPYLRADDLIIGAPAGNEITMTGSAIRLVPTPNMSSPVLCSSINLQMEPNSNAVVYVLNAAPGITMSYHGAGTTVVNVLGPGTSTQPGQQWTYPSASTPSTQGGNVDMRYFGLYGVGTGPDVVIATCALRQ